MLMLIFEVEDQQYALNTHCVVEVLPSLKLHNLHSTPDAIAGLFNYKGKIVPVINVNQLFEVPSGDRTLSQRIILVKDHSKKTEDKLFGLLVNKIIDTTFSAEIQESDEVTDLFQSPYLGKMFLKQNNILQYLHIEHLLSDQEYERLVSEPELDPELADEVSHE